ncbi:XdhC family protein [Salibacterium aidingense]|uniref:XdhC family protein n=1 Tax=Salibacterium aidingense TaxID=384933 RepID=UPI003BCE00FD
MEDIHSILKHVLNKPEQAVLATIIHVEGSAYRKEGTSMLVQADGFQIGLLSGGCLEDDIHARFEDICRHGPRLMTYDMRGEKELSWGEGSGCNGVIQVLLEPINEVMFTHMHRLKDFLEQGQTVYMAKKLTSLPEQLETLYQTANDSFGTWSGFGPESWMAEKSGVKEIEESGDHVYFHRFEPKPRLFVFGANTDARPLVHLAARSGFSVTVSDWRPALCSEAFFPEADMLVVGFPEELKNSLSIGPNDYAVLLTHHFQRDKELLPFLMEKKLKYLGVLGSRSRTARLLDGGRIPEEINTPAGLSIAAEGPDEIAVSIVSELIMRSKERTSQPVVMT